MSEDSLKVQSAIDTTYQNIKAIVEKARSTAYRTINFVMVQAYWEVGRIIVEEEQKGAERAEYGKALIKELSVRLTRDYGKGFIERNLWYMEDFYLTFPKVNALRSELTWTHYRLLLKVEKKEARNFYMLESVKNNWSTRELERQINSLLYERLAEKGDVLVSVRAPVGRINIANTKIIVGSGLAALRHEGVLQSFLFHQSKNIFAEEDSMGSGSIFNAITKEDMSGIKFLVPNKSLDRKFNELMGSLDKQIEILQSQIENLRQTRDFLLPKFILGEIDVEKLNINMGELEQ